jgi:hypothetical protein
MNERRASSRSRVRATGGLTTMSPETSTARAVNSMMLRITTAVTE